MKLTDPDDLNIGTELTVNTGTKVITLNVAGNLVAKDGVTLQALYSKLEDLWTSSTYNNHPFPMYAIDFRSGQFYFGFDGVSYNGWVLANDTVRSYIRDSGWREYLANGTLDREYVGVVSLGDLNSGAQVYYQTTSSGAATNFTYTDEPNEAILVYEDGGIDTRAFFKAYAREYNYLYDSSDLTDTGLTATGPYKINVLLSNSSDLKIQNNDAYVAANAPYTGITATWLVGNGFSTATVSTLVADDVRQDTAGRWFICTVGGTLDAAGVADYTNNGGTATLTAYSGERLVDADYYAFNIIVDGNAATKEQIYTKLQYLSRQAGDIDSGSGTHLGKVTNVLSNFVGSTLVTTTGVYIDDTLTADSAFLTYTDVGGVERSIPVVTNQSVTITGPTAGSRIQIYDLTSATELYNGTPTFPYTWTDPSVYAADREIRLRVAYVNAGTSANQFFSGTIGTATETDYALSYLFAPETDTVYAANAVNGSTVTDIVVDYAGDRITFNKSAITWQDLYAYEMYWLFTATGIAGDGQIITAIDTANYYVNDTIAPNLIENIYAHGVKASGGWGRLLGTDDPGVFRTSGYSVFPQVPHVVAYSSGGGTESDYYSSGDYLIPLN